MASILVELIVPALLLLGGGAAWWAARSGGKQAERAAQTELRVLAQDRAQRARESISGRDAVVRRLRDGSF